MNDKRKEIGRRIRQIREKLKLSQERFGVLIGTSASAVSAYEIGDSFCSIPVLFKIAEIGLTTPGWLIMGDDKAQEAIEKLLSRDDIRLLNAFHRATEADRKLILRIAESVVDNKSKDG